MHTQPQSSQNSKGKLNSSPLLQSLNTPVSYRVLSVFMLAMINVATCLSLKNLPFMAGFGMQSLFYYGLACFLFFIPCSLVAAELATGWPQEGGLYVWVKNALGPRWGFFAVWLQWVQNLSWFPTQFTFMGAAIAYLINPELAQNKIYAVSMVFILYWGTFFLNLKGMRVFGWMSSAGVVLGTLLPAGLLILFAGIGLAKGNCGSLCLEWKAVIPEIGSLTEIAFVAGMIFAVTGMEISAVHVREVQDPQRNYPKAIFLSAILVMGIYVLGTLAIAVLVPSKEHNLVSSVLIAFENFLGESGIWVAKGIIGLILLGALATLSAWIIGPAKGMLAATHSGELPPLFRKVNKHNMPVSILILQGVIVCSLTLVYLTMPSVEMAFWLMTILCSQFYLIAYCLMFISAIVLRFTHSEVKRSYTIPGGKIGMVIVAGVGLLTCLFGIVVGYIKPEGQAFSQLDNTTYPFIVVGWVLVFCLIPFIIATLRKPEWANVYKEEEKRNELDLES